MPREALEWFKTEGFDALKMQLVKTFKGATVQKVDDNAADGIPALLIHGKRKAGASEKFPFDLQILLVFFETDVNKLYGMYRADRDEAIRKFPERLVMNDANGSIDWMESAQNSSTPISGFLAEFHA